MRETKELLSIVVPCYNEEQAIEIFYKKMLEVEKKLQKVELEFVFIDDGSSDRTLEIIQNLRALDDRIHYRTFSRNFGKEAAVYAGLQYAHGDYVATMDVDLQDPPDLLPEMLDYIKEGYDCVATRRSTRKGEPIIRSFFARLFYKIMNSISQTDIVDGARDYRLMTRQVVEAICKLGEYNRFLKGIYGWVGFKTKWLEYENVERSAGITKWSFTKLFIYSIEGIVAFSTFPLVIVSVMGVILCIASFVFLVVIFFKALMFGDPVAGWPSTICIIVLLGGIQLLSLGIVGIYLSKIYLETKNRPIYIIKKEE